MKSILVLSLLLDVAGSGSRLTAQSSGKFTPTGNMGMERMAHTATLLTNGKVLIAGGFAIISGWPAWANAELYDPATGTFAATGSMTTSRFSHSATLRPDGKVLITGGSKRNNNSAVGCNADNNNCILSSAELYDASTGTFTPAGEMNAARAYHTATLWQGLDRRRQSRPAVGKRGTLRSFHGRFHRYRRDDHGARDPTRPRCSVTERFCLKEATTTRAMYQSATSSTIPAPVLSGPPPERHIQTCFR